MQLKLPKQLLDWVIEARGDKSSQAFIIDQLFLLKQTANQKEGVNYDTERKDSIQTRT